MDLEEAEALRKKINSPENKKKKKLTENWIMLMLFADLKSTSDLIRDGCKAMVFGWEYNEFKEILAELQREGKIKSDGSRFLLTEPGLFEVKRNTIVPLLNLTGSSNYFEKFIQENKENCNIEFLNLLYSQKNEKDKESLIVNFGEKHFPQIGIIVEQAIKWFIENPPT